MRRVPLTGLVAGGLALVVVLVWTLGLFMGDLAGTPVASSVEIGGPAALLWRAACLVAGVGLVLSARDAVRRVDPAGRAGAAALLVQLGGVALVLWGVVPARTGTEGAVLLAEDDPALAYDTVAALVLGALVPAAGFLLAARWRSVPQLRRETVVGFATAVVALWAMLAASLDPAPDATWGPLAQRVAVTAALGWIAWLLVRSLDAAPDGEPGDIGA